MVIDFKSERRMEKIKMQGRIYIDVESNAIVSIDYTGDYRLPIMLKPLLFTLGINVERPTFRKRLDYQKVNGLWYPENIQIKAALVLKKTHWFAPDEHSHIEVDGIYAINKLTLDNVKQIPDSKKYDRKKKMEEQVHNDNEITWSQINVIKR
jgi:hypothetical protein